MLHQGGPGQKTLGRFNGYNTDDPVRVRTGGHFSFIINSDPRMGDRMPCLYCSPVLLNEWAVVRMMISDGTDGQSVMMVLTFKVPSGISSD